MKILNITELMEDYSKRTSKFCIYMLFNTRVSIDKIIEAVPFIEGDKLRDLISYSTNRSLVLTFSTVEEMEQCFNQIKDTGAVYAVTFEKGKITDEI